MVTYTTTYNLAKPTVGDDEDVWGGYLNGNFDTLESLLKGTTALTSLSLTGTLTAPYLRLTGTGDASASSTTHAFQVGASGGGNIIMDANEIMARSNGAVSSLHLNADGGSVTLHNNTTAGTFTIGGNTVWHAGNDGSGSGLDADTLDGQEGSYYLNTSTTFGGDVSGTYDAIVVANDSHTHDGRYYTETEADSRFVLANQNNLQLIPNIGFFTNDGGGNLGIRFNADVGSGTNYSIEDGSAWEFQFNNDTTSGDFVIYRDVSISAAGEAITWEEAFKLEGTDTEGYLYGNKIWHAGNDGTGSGLDADTVDGIEASSFLRSDATDAFSGTITSSAAGIGMMFYGAAAWRVSSADSAHQRADARDDVGESRLHWYGVNTSGSSRAFKHAWYDGSAYVNVTASSSNINFERTTGTANLQVHGNTVWHAGNDGSGSGLDADTLDGVQGANYLRSDQADTFNGNLTISSTGTIGGSTLTNGYLQVTDGSNTLAMDSNEIVSNSTLYVKPLAGTLELGGSQTTNFGSNVNINGNLNAVDNIYVATNIYHEGDTDTKIDFGTNTINLRAGNQHEVQITQSGMFLINSALHEDYDALSGTTPSVDPNLGGAWSLTLSGNTTFTFGGTINNYSTGIIIELTGNATTAYTVTWPTSVDWAGGTAPDAPAVGETDIYVFWTRDGGTTWYGVQSIDAAA